MSTSLLGILSKTQALRHDAYLNLQHQRGMESHSTHNALIELLKPEIQKKIKETNDPIQLKQLALEIANDATANVYRNQKDDMYSLQQPSIIQGVMYYLRS